MMSLLDRFYSFILMPQDKANHSFWGLFTYSLIALYNIDVAIIATFVSATSKEIYDEAKYKGFDWLDLAYTFVPALIVYCSTILIKTT